MESLTFEAVRAVTQHPLMILAVLAVWLIPLTIFFILGIFRKARTSSGSIIYRGNKPVRTIQTLNFWLTFLIFFLVQGTLLFILIIYPVWLMVG